MSAAEKKSRTVLLLRAAADSPSKVDNYSKLASTLHFIQLVHLPVLTFNFINSDSLLRELNNNYENYVAIVFTSQRAVEAVEAISADIVDFEEKWTKNKLCYVVGEETGSKVRSSLNWETTKIVGSEAGNALRLAEIIIAKHEKHECRRGLLFPCGNLKRNDLEEALTKHNIPLQPLTVYETIPRTDITNAIKQWGIFYHFFGFFL